MILRGSNLHSVASFDLVYSNPSQSQVFGEALTGAIGLPLKSVLPNITRTGVLDHFALALRTGRNSAPIRVEYEDDRIARGRFILRAVPLATDLLMVITEIPASRPEGTVELSRMEERFRKLIEQAPDAMVFASTTGVIVLANAQAERMFGYTKEELVGSSIEVIVPQDEASLHRSHRKWYENDTNSPVIRRGLELRAQRKDGTEFPAEVAFSTLDVDGGLKVLATIRDISERKQCEHALQESVQRSRDILDNAYDAFVAMDDEGRIMGWNAAAEKTFGWSRSEAIGKQLSETIIPPSYQAAHHAGFHRYLGNGEAHVLDRRMRLVAQRRDGTQFPVELSIRSAMENGRLVFNAFIADITERERAERELAELNRTLEQRVEERSNELIKSETRYHNALDSMMEGVAIISFDWRYLYLNDAAVAQSRYSREEVLGKTMMEKYPGVEQTDLFKSLQRCMTTRVPEVLKNDFTFPNGSKAYFELSVQPTADGLFILSTDVTDRVNAEERLRDSETRFRSIIEQFPLAVVTYAPDGSSTNANRAWEHMWNDSRENALGYNIRLDPVLIASGLSRHVEAAFSGELAEADPYLYDPAAIGHQGRKRWIKMVLFPLKDDRGDVREVVLVMEDVTGRKQAELEIEEQRKRLEEQNKELEQFTFIASHDLQEPLRMISSYLQLLQRRYTGKLDNDANEFIAFAMDGALRMKNLIHDLLVYSRLDKPLELADVNMEAVLADALSNLGEAVTESNARITHGALPVIIGAHTQLVQVMQNLVSNAIKFSKVDTVPEVHVDTTFGNGGWTFSVKDNGIGMDEQYSDRLFVPFKRLSNSPHYSGTGIGLAIAKKTVERFGGRIWFRSEPGVGTTFFFTLPQKPLDG